MKLTIDLPDQLLRRAKAVAEARGVGLDELIAEGLELLLARWPDMGPMGKSASAYESILKKGHGLFDSGVENLGSDPKHLEGFGK